MDEKLSKLCSANREGGLGPQGVGVRMSLFQGRPPNTKR